MIERRYMLSIFGKEFEIDEDDMKKLEENAGEMLVKLKQVMVHPPNIAFIHPFTVPYRQLYKQQKVILKDGRADYHRVEDGPPQPPKKIVDLFGNLEELKQLHHGKNEIDAGENP